MCDLGCSLKEPSFCESRWATGGGHMKNNKSPDWRPPLSIHSIYHWPVVGVTHLGRRTPSSRWPAPAASTWNLNRMPPSKPCPNYRIKQVTVDLIHYVYIVNCYSKMRNWNRVSKILTFNLNPLLVRIYRGQITITRVSFGRRLRKTTEYDFWLQ